MNDTDFLCWIHERLNLIISRLSVEGQDAVEM